MAALRLARAAAPVAPVAAPVKGDHLAAAREGQMADPNSYINSPKWTLAKLTDLAQAYTWNATQTAAIEAFLGCVQAKDDETRANKAAKVGAPPATRGRKPAAAPAAPVAQALPAPRAARAAAPAPVAAPRAAPRAPAAPTAPVAARPAIRLAPRR